MFHIIPIKEEFYEYALYIKNLLLKYNIETIIDVSYHIPMKLRIKYNLERKLVINKYELETNTVNYRKGLLNLNYNINQLINYCS